jgi:hypothetical protein
MQPQQRLALAGYRPLQFDPVDLDDHSRLPHGVDDA